MSRTDTTAVFTEWGKKIQGAMDSNLLEREIDTASHHNPWHTRENIVFALGQIVRWLESKRLGQWLERYPQLDTIQRPRTVAVIMNGDVPLAGFRDMLSVLASNNRVLIKLSDYDDVMIPALAKILTGIAPEFEDYISFAKGRMHDFDAVIASSTGTLNPYFEKYFAKYPNIIRQPKKSIAVLSGNETEKQLERFTDDIFLYMGLGNRSVSKIYVPENYDFGHLTKASEKYRYLFDNNQYKSSLDYHKALLLLNAVPFVDGDFWMLKQDDTLEAPVSMLNYATYASIDTVQDFINGNAGKIQCVVSECDGLGNCVPFGKSWRFEPWDYDDNTDTIKFLTDLQ